MHVLAYQFCLFFGWYIGLGWIGHSLSVIALVWILNLYNSMDGIDGLAGGQAIISTAVMGFILLFVFGQSDFC